MCRIATIFLIALMLIAAAAARHHLLHRRAVAVPAMIDDESPDVAAALRSMTGHTDIGNEKSWAVRFAQFINDHPGARWAVGRSRTPALSEQEAAQLAHQDGAARVYALVYRDLGPSRFEADWLRGRVNRDVEAGRVDADCFAESFTRPYGKVWTESVLLDVSPARLEPLLSQYRRELNQRHVQFAWHVAILASVVVITALFYLLLNSITKGYFTTRLRLAATLVVAAVVLFL